MLSLRSIHSNLKLKSTFVNYIYTCQRLLATKETPPVDDKEKEEKKESEDRIKKRLEPLEKEKPAGPIKLEASRKRNDTHTVEKVKVTTELGRDVQEMKSKKNKNVRNLDLEIDKKEKPAVKPVKRETLKKTVEKVNVTPEIDEKVKLSRPLHIENLVKPVQRETLKKTVEKVNVRPEIDEKVKLSRPLHIEKGNNMMKIKNKNVAELVSAARGAAEELGGDISKTETELLQNLLKGYSKSEKVESTAQLMSSMTVKKKTDPEGEYYGRSSDNVSRKRRHRERESFEMYDENMMISDVGRLNIFPKDYLRKIPQEREGKIPVWKLCEERHLLRMKKSPPTNIYEEMIQMTEEGKLWHFPIDNEQGMDEEKQVDFSDHVFLDKHLESWCPSGGPIRHFMELVLIGLARNPYISVQAKIDHIEWFKNYFEDKKQFLIKLGAYGKPEELSSNTTDSGTNVLTDS